jgi:tetratricopeptide (TPR) repeat protein
VRDRCNSARIGLGFTYLSRTFPRKSISLLNVIMSSVCPVFSQAPNSLLSQNELKDKGNKAFQAKDYDTAIELFTQAIALDSQNHVLYSNRSAARAGKKQWDAALEDAEQVIVPHFQIAVLRLLTLLSVHQHQSVLVERIYEEGRSAAWCSPVG